jgi:transglutaminase/protease-like cytokinesis protein 3
MKNVMKKAGMSVLTMTMMLAPVSINAEEEVEAPAISKITVVGNSISKIKWNKEDCDGYIINRKTSVNGKWKSIGEMAESAQLFAYDGNIKNATYYYSIQAYKKVNGETVKSDINSHVYKITYKNTNINMFKGGNYKKGSVYGPTLSTKALKQVKKAVTNFVNMYITKDMTTVQKCMIAQMYLSSHCVYASTWSKNNANNAWGALVYKNKKGMHEAQCSGYARAYKALCDGMGIGCSYVHANKASMNPSHQWNEVKTKGKWYIVDPQTNASSGFLAFFFCGKKTYQKTGMRWSTKSYPAVSSADYSLQKVTEASNSYPVFYMSSVMK